MQRVGGRFVPLVSVFAQASRAEFWGSQRLIRCVDGHVTDVKRKKVATLCRLANAHELLSPSMFFSDFLSLSLTLYRLLRML